MLHKNIINFIYLLMIPSLIDQWNLVDTAGDGHTVAGASGKQAAGNLGGEESEYQWKNIATGQLGFAAGTSAEGQIRLDKYFEQEISQNRQKIVSTQGEISKRESELKNLYKTHAMLQGKHSLLVQNWKKVREEMNARGWHEQQAQQQSTTHQRQESLQQLAHQMPPSVHSSHQILPPVQSQRMPPPVHLPTQSLQKNTVFPQFQAQSGMIPPFVAQVQPAVKSELQPQFLSPYQNPPLHGQTYNSNIQDALQQQHQPGQWKMRAEYPSAAEPYQHQLLVSSPQALISQESIQQSIAHVRSPALLETGDVGIAISESTSRKDKRKQVEETSTSQSSADASTGEKRKKILHGTSAYPSPISWSDEDTNNALLSLHRQLAG